MAARTRTPPPRPQTAPAADPVDGLLAEAIDKAEPGPLRDWLQRMLDEGCGPEGEEQTGVTEM